MIGIIGGTGLGDTLASRMKDAKLIDVSSPADKILVGPLGNNRRVAFLNRHGPSHYLCHEETRCAYYHCNGGSRIVGKRVEILEGCININISFVHIMCQNILSSHVITSLLI